MGSLPELTERARPARAGAARTISDPQRHRTVITQIPVNTIYRKEWLWRKPKPASATRAPAVAPCARRRDSASSSVGATSVRRLLARQPPKLSPLLVWRFTFLCLSSSLCATALVPFTAFVGAEAGALPLSIMHATAAIFAPLSPRILQKTGTRLVITLSHLLVCILLSAHTVSTPLSVLLPLYALCGVALSPMSLALAVSAAGLAQTAGDERRRKVTLRRALRGLRAAQDLGLVAGALMLGGALLIWPEDVTPPNFTPAPTNSTVPKWPPSTEDEYFLEDDYEEHTCGSAGCPDTQAVTGIVLTAEGRRYLVGAWAVVALLSVGLAIYGAPAAPAAPPDTRTTIRDARTLLGVPMGLFIGLHQGFIYTSYMKWYGVCVGGWACAWRALLGAGALQSLAAATLSMAAARGRRLPLAAGGCLAHASLMLALLRWRAARTDLALPAVAAAAAAACAALWDVLQVGVCVGGTGWRGPWSATIAARHLGLALAAAARGLLCVRAQLPTLAAALVVAVAAHVWLELKLRKVAEAGRHRS